MQRNRIEWNRIVLDDFYFCTNVRCQRHATNYEIFEQWISVRAVDVGSLLYIGQADAVATTTTTLFHLGKFSYVWKTFRSSGIERFTGERRKGQAIAERKTSLLTKQGQGNSVKFYFHVTSVDGVCAVANLKLAITRREGYNRYSQSEK